MDKNTKSEFSFRRFLILLVIVLGGLFLLLTYLPSATACVAFLVAGAFILYVGITALRIGSVSINARTKSVTYTRTNNPIEFWFYVVFFILFGIFISVFAFYFLPGMFNIIRNFVNKF